MRFFGHLYARFCSFSEKFYISIYLETLKVVKHESEANKRLEFTKM